MEYAAATSVDEAVSLLAARGDRVQLLAGGTDLLARLHDGAEQPNLIVDVKQIPELMEMHFDRGDGLWLGAAVPCRRIYEEATVAAAYPGLVDVARILGGWQIQTRASLGGNLCNASPAADVTPLLIAHDALCHVAGPGGRRIVAVADFCTAPGQSVLGRGEMLTAIQLPPPAPHTSSAYLRFIPRNEMDIAVAGAGCHVRLDASGNAIIEARIGLGAVAPTPLAATAAADWLGGQPATPASCAEAAHRARAIARPITDKRGTAEFRTHVVGVLVERALGIAIERGRETK